MDKILKFNEFFNNILNEGINDKYLYKAIYTAGGPGSGKSFVAESMFGGDIPFLNSDILFELLLKKTDLPLLIDDKKIELYKMQMAQRKIAKLGANQKFFHFVNGLNSMVIDGTGADMKKVEEFSEIIKSYGYDTYMVFINTTLDVAQERNQKRERTVPESVVTEKWEEVQANIGKFKSYFKDNLYIIENSETLDKAESGKFKKELANKGMKILKSPLKNEFGIEVIKYLKDNGGKYLEDFTISEDELKALAKKLKL